MSHRKLQGRGAQRAAVSGANCLDPAHPVHDVRRGWRVIEARTRQGTHGKNAGVVNPSQHHANCLLQRQRQKIIQASLNQQRIVAGHHHHIKITGTGKLGAPIGLVEADPDGTDHPLGTQLIQRDIGPRHGLFEALIHIGQAMGPHIAIMNQHHVQPVEPGSQQRLLD